MKEREINNAQEKINIALKELKVINRKGGKTEGDRLVDLDKKIKMANDKGADLKREIKHLKKVQIDQGNELVGLEVSDEHQEKIKSLIEEIRWAKEKQLEY